MRVVTTAAEARRECSTLAKPMGFVPTMGALHAAHLSLIRRSQRDNAATVVSIFVNPTQFGANEDFNAYPRDLQTDLATLEREGVDVVFAPAAAEMYTSAAAVWVDVEGVSERLEGAHRPGHFRGVATVVAKLLLIVSPQRAYFGQKDAQQLAVIRAMASQLFIPTEIVAMPTIREPDGLAMSSRNARLTAQQRRDAAVIYRGLSAAKALWENGERRSSILRHAVAATLATAPALAVDYISVVEPESFVELETANAPATLAVAARLGDTRLIDNVSLAPQEG